MSFRKPHVDRSPQRILIHPEYDDDTLEFDIALVKIKAVKFSSHIQPVALPATDLASGRKRRKLRNIWRKETRKRLESEQRLAKEGIRKKRKIERNKLKKWKKKSESRIYQTQKRMKERLRYFKQKRNLIKQNLNEKIALQSDVKTSGKQRKGRTKQQKKRTLSKNELKTISKLINRLKDKIMKLRKELKKKKEYEYEEYEYYEEECNVEEEQAQNKRITWY